MGEANKSQSNDSAQSSNPGSNPGSNEELAARRGVSVPSLEVTVPVPSAAAATGKTPIPFDLLDSPKHSPTERKYAR